MISKLKGGILSCIGLMLINIIRGILMIPNLELENYMIYILVIQLGYLWFTISLWIVIKYDIVKLNYIEKLRRPLDWLIRNFAIVSGASILSTFFPNREFYFLIILAGIILFVNYIIVFVKLYRLDKDDLEFVGDLHNYIIAMIALAIVYSIISVINEYKWHMELDYLFHFFSVIPIFFLMRFLFREKKDIEEKQKLNSME